MLKQFKTIAKALQLYAVSSLYGKRVRVFINKTLTTVSNPTLSTNITKPYFMKHSVGQKIQIILLSDDFKYIFEQRTTCDKKFVKLTLNPQKSYRMIMRRNLFEQIH